MKKVKLKETLKDWSRNSNYSNSVFYHIEELRLLTSQQISSTENQQFQTKCNTSTITDRLPTVPRSTSLLGTVTEHLYLQKTVHSTYVCKGTLVPFPWFFVARENCERAAKRWPRVAKRRERKTSRYFGLESHFHADARVRIWPSGSDCLIFFRHANQYDWSEGWWTCL